MIEFTAFKNIFDNRTGCVKSFESWEDFGTALLSMSKMKGYKPSRGEKVAKGKFTSPLISPAIYKKGTTRANQNVSHWAGWAALDIDDIDDTLENTLKVFQDYRFYCYSSASSTKESPRFRVVLHLSSNVQASDIKHFWFAINKEFNSLVDPQTKDMSRMYYVPANYPNAYNFIFSNEGKKIDPSVLMMRHDYVEPYKDFISTLPESMQRALIQKQKDSLTNLDVTWTSYKDCPFVNKNMVSKYSDIAYTDGSGRYAFMYKLMLNIAGNALRRKYPITPKEIAGLIRGVDQDFGSRYKNRALETEAERAITFALRTSGQI